MENELENSSVLGMKVDASLDAVNAKTKFFETRNFSMSFTNVSKLEQIRPRVIKTLTDGIQLDMSTDESKKFLKRHVNRKTNVVIMFVDINNSTEMSLSLPEDKFALMIQPFAQEITIAVTGYGGYVFKLEGDAVIVLFPGEFDQAKAYKNALSCTTSTLEIIRQIINPAFEEKGLPQITVRIGLDFGEALVVPYWERYSRKLILI
jgi:adenylate cyclase